MSLRTDFYFFARAQLVSGDIDPMYPVLREFYTTERLEPEIALWRTLLYVTWYHIGSAAHVWRKYPTPRALTVEDVRGLATGTERRGFRGNALAAVHVNAVLAHAPGGLTQYFDQLTSAGGEAGWARARQELQTIAWLGPWASYKWADLLKNVHGYPITANDIGVGGNSETAGPVPGMVRLTGLTWQECARGIETQRRLLAESQAAGVPFTGLDQLETALCDFNSLCKGGYYVGHDIDQQMTQLASVPEPGLWEARGRAFPERYLGERGGWSGVRKELKSLYAKTGKLVVL
jgi:hypothetical protein